MPKVLLITRYFPPLDSIATLRMYFWAKYLNQQGFDVSILTTSKHQQVVVPLNLDISKFQVSALSYFDPIAALGFDKKREANTLACASATFKNAIKKQLKNFYQTRMNERIPGRTDPWILPALRELKKRRKQGLHYDYIISSYGPPSAHIVGSHAKQIFNSHWIADYRDLWLENHVYKGLWPFTWLENVLEKRMIRSADLITTVSDSFQDTLQNKFPSIPVHTIENGFDPDTMKNARNDYFRDHQKAFRIVYTGSIYAKKRDPSPLFAAVQQLIASGQLPRDSLEILFYGSCAGDLEELIQKHKVEGIAKYRGTVPHGVVYDIQRSANALLFLEDPNPEIDGNLTGKLFEYLAVDVPILAVGIRPASAPGQLITQTGSGFIGGTDVGLIKKILLDLIQKNYHMEKKHEIIQQYTREKQVAKLVSLMTSLKK